jgi:PAS domain-containing protein
VTKRAAPADGPADRPADPPAPVEAGEALAGVVARLREELAGMRRAMGNRAVIEQAKGVLVARLGVTPDAAFDQLVRLSQRTNIKLAEVAAALVGATAPAPDTEAPGELIDEELGAYLARARRPAAPPAAQPAEPAAEALRAQHQLLAARITAATGYPQIAEIIAAAGRGWPAPDAVLVALRAWGPDRESEPDALRAVGSHGVPESGAVAEALYRVGAEAVRTDAVAWEPDTGRAVLRSVLAAPLVVGDETVGVLAVGWVARARVDGAARRYLAALAEPIARRVGQLTPADATTGDPVRQALAGMPAPAALLSPVRDADGRPTDFRYDYVNAAAAAELAELTGPTDPAGLAGPPDTERTLLALLPDTGSRLLLGEFAAVLAGGGTRELADVPIGSSAARLRVSRIGDRLLVAWQPASTADLLYDQLLSAERIGRLGSFWWDLAGGDARFSPELYRLLGRDPEAGALPLPDLGGYVYPDDRLAVQEALRGTLLAGRTLTVEFRLADAPGRRLRATAEPEFDADGSVSALRGTVQDVTEERAVESRLRRAEEALAAQRLRLRAEARAAATLRDALLPTNPELTATPGLAVRGLCRSPESTGRVAGDWYDVFAVPAGDTYLVVGDVTGTGLAATVAAARLRNAVRAYAVLGMAPGELLTALNKLPSEALATLVVARFTAGTRELRWAAAGQAAPLRYDAAGRAAVLTGPLGLPLGATPDIGYEETAVGLRRGDRVLLYTDGLVLRRDRTLASGLDVLLHAADHADLADLPALVDYVSTALDATPDDDLAVVCGRTD